MPCITSGGETVSAAPIRGSEDIPRDRVGCPCRSISDAVEASGSPGMCTVPQLARVSVSYNRLSEQEKISHSLIQENMLSSAEPLKPKSRSSNEAELLSPAIP